MSEEVRQRMSYLDLLITVLMEHEKALDEMIGNLTLAVQELTKLVDSEKKRNELMLRYYGQTEKVIE